VRHCSVLGETDEAWLAKKVYDQHSLFMESLKSDRTSTTFAPIQDLASGRAGQAGARSKRMAPQVGLEPTTLRLTAGCSAIELLRSVADAPERRAFELLTRLL
jgi:hypothetical protein